MREMKRGGEKDYTFWIQNGVKRTGSLYGFRKYIE